MFNIGPEKLVLLLAIALIVLGPSRLPQAARTIAKVLAEFRKISSAVQTEVNDVLREPRQIFNEALKEPREMFHETLSEPRQAFGEYRDTIAGAVGDFRLDATSTPPASSADSRAVDNRADDSVGMAVPAVPSSAAPGHPLPAPPDDPTLN